MTGLTVPANSWCVGKPVLSALSNEHQLLLASLVWWSVFYSPGDLAYSLATNKVEHFNLLPLSNSSHYHHSASLRPNLRGEGNIQS